MNSAAFYNNFVFGEVVMLGLFEGVMNEILPSYTTSTKCHPGVHPQPTFTGTLITVTETSSVPSGSQIHTSKVTTMAEMSVSVSPPAATDISDYMFYTTPSLRTVILRIANSFRPVAKENGHSDGSAAPSCRLPQSARQGFITEVTRTIGQAVDLNDRRLARQVATPVFATHAASIFILGDHFRLASLIKSDFVESVASNKEDASSSTTLPGAPTMFPGPPYNNVLGPIANDVDALTNYRDSYFTSKWPGDVITLTTTPKTQRLPCTHGAQPGVYRGTAAYCQCTDGKIYKDLHY